MQVSILTTQLCYGNAKAAIDDKQMRVYGSQ